MRRIRNFVFHPLGESTDLDKPYSDATFQEKVQIISRIQGIFRTKLPNTYRKRLLVISLSGVVWYPLMGIKAAKIHIASSVLSYPRVA